MNNRNVNLIVKSFLEARSNNYFISNQNSELIPNNESEAYLIQNKVHNELDKISGKVIGKKIGCTTKIMQNYLGIDHPCVGTLRDANSYNSGTTLNMNRFTKVGVECELAVKLSRDLLYSNNPKLSNIYKSIEYVFPAIEIVDDRYSNWKDFSASHLIADDFFSAGCVLGLDRYNGELLKVGNLEGSMYINNKKIGSGIGNHILGNPFNALKWLISRKEIIGPSLKKGSIILLGSLVETSWVNKGDKVKININGMGSVSANFQ